MSGTIQAALFDEGYLRSTFAALLGISGHNARECSRAGSIIYLVIVRHLSRPSPRMVVGHRYGDPHPYISDRIKPSSPFFSVSVPSLETVNEWQSDGMLSRLPLNMWAFDESKTTNGEDSYSKGLVTMSACEILPLQLGDTLSFEWNWRGETWRCTCDAAIKPPQCECRPIGFSTSRDRMPAPADAHPWEPPAAGGSRVRRCITCNKACTHVCYPHSPNPLGQPSALLYSFTLLRLMDTMAVACFDRCVNGRARIAEWRPRRSPDLPATPFVVGVEHDGVLRVPSPGNYLLLARLAVGIDDESQGAGEQIALQARAADAGPAGWADLCCFGRDHNEFHTGRSHLCEMISMGDVHALDAGTCLRFEARGKAIFDDAISSEVKRSQSFSLLRLGCEYARFRYGRCGLGPLMVRANSCQL